MSKRIDALAAEIAANFPAVSPNAVPAYSVVKLWRKANKPYVVVSNRQHYNRIVDFYSDPRAAKMCADRLNLGKE